MAMVDHTASGPPVTLSVAGSDSGGGAGIQADIKTFTVLECFAATAVTGVTAQNTRGVQDVSLIEPAMVTQQINAVMTDMRPAAIKTGMLGSKSVIDAVADALGDHQAAPLVVDPVMIAKSGDALIDEAAVDVMAGRMLPLARVVTPNRFEVARLLGRETDLRDASDAEVAGREICARFGCQACVVKAIPADESLIDVLWDACDQTAHSVTGRAHPNEHTHGSGCGFSAAITGFLAHGHALPQAVARAKTFIDAAIAGAAPVGQGARPINAQAFRK